MLPPCSWTNCSIWPSRCIIFINDFEGLEEHVWTQSNSFILAYFILKMEELRKWHLLATHFSSGVKLPFPFCSWKLPKSERELKQNQIFHCFHTSRRKLESLQWQIQWHRRCGKRYKILLNWREHIKNDDEKCSQLRAH